LEFPQAEAEPGDVGRGTEHFESAHHLWLAHSSSRVSVQRYSTGDAVDIGAESLGEREVVHPARECSLERLRRDRLPQLGVSRQAQAPGHLGERWSTGLDQTKVHRCVYAIPSGDNPNAAAVEGDAVPSSRRIVFNCSISRDEADIAGQGAVRRDCGPEIAIDRTAQPSTLAKSRNQLVQPQPSAQSWRSPRAFGRYLEHAAPCERVQRRSESARECEVGHLGIESKPNRLVSERLTSAGVAR
jgi:hypothetical protein